jgi:hypothetical protein
MIRILGASHYDIDKHYLRNMLNFHLKADFRETLSPLENKDDILHINQDSATVKSSVISRWISSSVLLLYNHDKILEKLTMKKTFEI